jgi:hypothetical protein
MIPGARRNRLADDYLEAQDLERVVLTGQIPRRFTRDPRGTRYEVSGTSTDGRRASVVCRFLASGVLRIITAYTEEEGEGLQHDTHRYV